MKNLLAKLDGDEAGVTEEAIRLFLAAACMYAMKLKPSPYTREEIARKSILQADGLLKQLKK